MASTRAQPGTFDVDSILDRVAEVAGASSDSELARALGISPQVLSKWRSRGTVRFKQVHDFAARTGASLDFIVLGVGSRKRRSLDVDPGLFLEVWIAFEMALKKNIDQPIRAIAPFEKVLYTAVLYNKVSSVPEDAHRRDAIRREAEYLVYLMAIRNSMEVPDPLAIAKQFAEQSDGGSATGVAEQQAAGPTKSRKLTTTKRSKRHSGPRHK